MLKKVLLLVVLIGVVLGFIFFQTNTVTITYTEDGYTKNTTIPILLAPVSFTAADQHTDVTIHNGSFTNLYIGGDDWTMTDVLLDFRLSMVTRNGSLWIVLPPGQDLRFSDVGAELAISS